MKNDQLILVFAAYNGLCLVVEHITDLADDIIPISVTYGACHSGKSTLIMVASALTGIPSYTDSFLNIDVTTESLQVTLTVRKHIFSNRKLNY